MRRHVVLGIAGLLLLVACKHGDGDGDADDDAGRPDAGVRDAGAPDATLDARGDDAGSSDAGDDGDASADATTFDGAVTCGGDAGAIDTTFGEGGVLRGPEAVAPSNGSEGARFAVDPDGHHIIVASAYYGAEQVFLRFDENGALDPTFGNGGMAVESGLTSIFGFAAQPDRKLVASGYATLAPGAGEFAFGITRLLPSGELDPTFGDGGVVVTSLTGRDFSAGDPLIEQDGTIVLAGSGGINPSGMRFEMVRYASDGTLDPTFGAVDGGADAGGVVVLAPPPADAHHTVLGPSHAILLVDSRILLAGQWAGYAAGQSPAPRGKLALARFSPDGVLDATFGTGGVLSEDFGSTNVDHAASSVAIDAQGRIVTAGSVVTSSEVRDFEVARFLADGAVDTSFGAGGRVVTDFNQGFDLGADLVILPTGAIVVVGTTQSPTPDDAGNTSGAFAVARYLDDGTLDATFGDAGKVVTPFPDGLYSRAAAALLDPGGCGVLVTGGIATPTPLLQLGVVRYTQ